VTATDPENPSGVGDNMSRRSARAIVTIQTSARHKSDSTVQVIAKAKSYGSPFLKGHAELDSHADTCCAGATAQVVEYTGWSCDVLPFSNEYDALKDIPIVTAATAYDDPETGDTYILVMHEALYFGDRMATTLLCPNQMRANGIVVDDVPIHLSPDRSSTHSIFVPDQGVHLPLHLCGCLSYLPTRLPTMKEIETLPWLTLTSKIEWEPYAERFAQSEKVLREFVPPVPEEERQLYALQREYCEIDSVMSSISPSLSSALFPDIPKSNIDFTESGSRKVGISSEVLAKRWGIGTKIAAQTLQVTTQKGVRNAVHPIQRRYRTKQLQLRYNQLGSQHG
jgi:hypothetical protein